MRTLGIETSCDDTGVAIYDSEDGLLVHQLTSQIKTHQQHGGVVPELAARDHIRTLMPLIDHVINDPTNQCKIPERLGYTAGPGLAGSLLVGASVAKSLAFAWNIPAIEIHHMEGHLLAPMLEKNPPKFPFVALLVSGGHTLLVDVSAPGKYTIIGKSVDDAAGEAFDKTAKLLGLEYPGGAAISKLAETGVDGRFHFPRPMTNRPGLDFSFSGLKTHTLTTVNQCIKDNMLDQQTKADIALAFEQAVVDTLTIKCKRALQQTNRNRLIVSGGVGANKRLRAKLLKLGKENNKTQQTELEVFYPRPELCTDNGAMIAYAAHFRFSLAAVVQDPYRFQIYPRWSLEETNNH